MENKKVDRYYAYLKSKRDEFIKNLIRIGVKLTNLYGDDFDFDSFYESFVPSRSFLKKKIEEELRKSYQYSMTEEKLNVSKNICIDSALINAVKDEFTKLENDFQELLKSTESDKEPSRNNEIHVESKRSHTDFDETLHNAHQITQVINPGELAKIFIQNSRFNIIRSMTDKPKFNEDPEAIYIYRSRNF
ncbi:CLUMA_CG007016, isoform A [Clunio marinus]|uniref:CLUMA_CG007016, isoform A n=1 Tax=Clunio marinus TaxID=568069 RepID=A0A1J1HZF1_9DIPT|nr:CLUMA_CG007016, isoform A [Clunio marinus]